MKDNKNLSNEQLQKVVGGCESEVFENVSFNCNYCNRTVRLSNPERSTYTLDVRCGCGQKYEVNFWTGRIVDGEENGVGGVCWSY
ncbi:MAG: hypothetical protein MJ236_03020 [Clostridia bacterium]|nr:hypothetical protein [Clostridia bacterium]